MSKWKGISEPEFAYRPGGFRDTKIRGWARSVRDVKSKKSSSLRMPFANDGGKDDYPSI